MVCRRNLVRQANFAEGITFGSAGHALAQIGSDLLDLHAVAAKAGICFICLCMVCPS
jgi:hypothetical protein